MKDGISASRLALIVYFALRTFLYRPFRGGPCPPVRPTVKLFRSRDPNIVHYVTAIAHRRAPVFCHDEACSLFVRTLAGTKRRDPFKLVGYVVMPDHVHLLANPFSCDIGRLMSQIKGLTARRVLDWLRPTDDTALLGRLELPKAKRCAHTHSLWQKDYSAIDLWSPRFIRQKLNYVHNNPVRAGLCGHPAEWKWSSYRAYFPHETGGVPIEVDVQGFWRGAMAGMARL